MKSIIYSPFLIYKDIFRNFQTDVINRKVVLAKEINQYILIMMTSIDHSFRSESKTKISNCMILRLTIFRYNVISVSLITQHKPCSTWMVKNVTRIPWTTMKSVRCDIGATTVQARTPCPQRTSTGIDAHRCYPWKCTIILAAVTASLRHNRVCAAAISTRNNRILRTTRRAVMSFVK